MHCGCWGGQGTTATAHGVVRAMGAPRRAKQWWQRHAATTSTPRLRRPSRSDIAPRGWAAPEGSCAQTAAAARRDCPRHVSNSTGGVTPDSARSCQASLSPCPSTAFVITRQLPRVGSYMRAYVLLANLPSPRSSASQPASQPALQPASKPVSAPVAPSALPRQHEPV
jgi:hypothetical protein